MDSLPPVQSRREDEIAWYARIEPVGISHAIELAFPKSFAFIRLLQRPEVNRLKKWGWSIEKTVFLDIPYLTTFFPFHPSQAGSWLIDVQQRDTYFICAAFCRGYVASADRIDLEDTILHEMNHLRENTEKAQTGDMPIGSGEPQEVMDREWKHEVGEMSSTMRTLSAKYGQRRVVQALQSANAIANREMRIRPVVFPIITEHWMGKYFSANWESLQGMAFKMPAGMKGGKWKDSWSEVENGASQLYAHFTGTTIPTS